MRFPTSWRFLLSAPNLTALPTEGPPEVAFAGRSNVGKSSLLNALTRQNALARTSNTPGRTQALNFFVPDLAGDDHAMPALALVDMPGYGFAKAPKSQVAAWTRLLLDYLKGRSTLRRVYVLIDSRHGIKENDREVLDLLDKSAVSYQIVLTKADKLKPKEREAIVSRVAEFARTRPAAHPDLILTSSQTGLGLDALREEIAHLVDEGN